MQPFAQYIERTLNRKVILSTARSYEQLLTSAQKNKYDFAYSPAHFAAQLINQNHYHPLLLLDVSYSALIVSLEKSDIKNPSDLRQKTLAIPNLLALVTRLALDELANTGVAEQDLTLLKKSTHDRALLALLSGEVDAAIISTTLIAALPEETIEKLHIVEVYGDVIGDVIITNQKLAKTSPELVENIIKHFPTSPEAKDFVDRWKFNIVLRPISAEELEPLGRLAQ